MSDPVNPKHYKQGSVECIDAIKSCLGDIGLHAYLRGNVIKYLWRYQDKGGATDLKKALWYLTRLIAEIEPPAPIVNGENKRFFKVV